MAVIPERQFLRVTERQRQEMRLQASRVIVDFAAAVASCRPARRGPATAGQAAASDALPVARVVRR
jgi:hypothetical protein